MNNAKEKKLLISKLQQVLKKSFIEQEPEIFQELKDLLNDIETDFFTIVVLGEFKRGKSTFINALLGSNVLPTDILPETAVISAIAYNEEPNAEVVYEDTHVTKGEATVDFLRKFSAKESFNPNIIKYIKIGYPAEFLKNRIILVDTPGVDDINEQRCEVTYKFIPKAHAVLFVLDANSPLKNTEKEFLKNRLLSLGVDNIVFIVNKYDNVDEEEEEEDLLVAIKERISYAFCKPVEELKVLPLSAKWALEGAVKQDFKFIEASGINKVKDSLLDIVYNGDVENQKIKLYQRRFTETLLRAVGKMESDKAFRQLDLDQLEDAKQALENMYLENAADKDSIAKFVTDEKKTIKSMVQKSLMFFL